MTARKPAWLSQTAKGGKRGNRIDPPFCGNHIGVCFWKNVLRFPDFRGFEHDICNTRVTRRLDTCNKCDTVSFLLRENLMNRMTTYRRLKKLCITKDTANLNLVEVAFDPVRAYSVLFEISEILAKYRIRSVTHLESVLERLK